MDFGERIYTVQIQNARLWYSTRVEYSTLEEKFVVGGMGMGMCVHSGGGAHFSSICFNAPVPWYMLLCATMVSWSGVSEVDGTCN